MGLGGGKARYIKQLRRTSSRKFSVELPGEPSEQFSPAAAVALTNLRAYVSCVRREWSVSPAVGMSTGLSQPCVPFWHSARPREKTRSHSKGGQTNLHPYCGTDTRLIPILPPSLLHSPLLSFIHFFLLLLSMWTPRLLLP